MLYEVITDGVDGHGYAGHLPVQIEKVGAEGQQGQDVGQGDGQGHAHEVADRYDLRDQGGDNHACLGLAEIVERQGQDVV